MALSSDKTGRESGIFEDMASGSEINRRESAIADTASSPQKNNSDYIAIGSDKNQQQFVIADDIVSALNKDTQQFAIIDDIASLLVIDIFYLNTKTHKINQNILGTFTINKKFQHKIKVAIKDFSMPVPAITNNLIEILENSFSYSDISNKMLKRQLKSYLKLVKPDSGFSVQVCDRYTRNVNQGVKICAEKFWPKNAILKNLNGFTVKLTKDELKYLADTKLDFSVMSLGTSNKMWLGPGSYVNHDCQPNSKLHTLKVNGELCLQAIKDINPGDEVTWNCGPEYFDVGKCECETCSVQNKNGQQEISPAVTMKSYVVLEKIMDESNNTSHVSDASSEAINKSLDLSINTINEILGT